MNVTNHILHRARLTNNCPECFATDGLEITFSQEEHDTKYYTKASPSIAETLYCHTCKTTIYPVSWTDDIERVYQYNKKLVVEKKAGIRLKMLTYILIAVVITLIITLVVLLLSN
ncbi:hypothetical protein ATE92_0822 [Ulvibacter sp. MAR_2010_11]|uniref:hypothetical protein n=1 Tax=Ulvibacter sp. MAR_2010_11 TaxID=1250229 RepID=UPI000C2C11C9|nr:hypothetical protein [Ulvibacter sp. MAR_2010_11]PKA82686.1 hypothetical protein ATE92_0822 [Ulvibacter sp. MAR_2010_11]